MSSSLAYRQDMLRMDFSGSNQRPASETPPCEISSYSSAWGDAFRSPPQCLAQDWSRPTSPTWVQVIADALPLAWHPAELEENPTISYLHAIETVFGNSPSDLAPILRVSRPMIYHYRGGKTPTPENFERLKQIGLLATENPDLAQAPLRERLKRPESNGKSLFDLLCEESLNLPAIRNLLHQVNEDRARRQRLAATLATHNQSEGSKDIMISRHQSGKPVYVADRGNPGKIIQIRPDQTRIRGRMVNRQFIPDE
jgi:hypothetical protein